MKGKLLIFSAPSGSGKTTIVRRLLDSGLNVSFSVSATSRKARANEMNGKDYYFMSADKFREKIKKNEFIEWEEVYSGSYYGTLRSEIDRIWKEGDHVVFDIDVKGGLNLKKLYKENALAIFIMPPSLKSLEERLILRNSENREKIIERLDKASYEISFANQFDQIIINDDLDKTINETIDIIKTFINK